MVVVTSVKEIVVDQAATAIDFGRGAFRFTDDFSVFDWGKMPDQIPGKGGSLCSMGAFNFERLEDAGVPTHYRGVIENGTVIPFSEAAEPPREMAIDLTQVPPLPFDGAYDYEAYHESGGENFLIPLEVVFRNEVPVGSSLRGRMAPGDVGLSHEEWPDESVVLDEPIVEFSTKYEEQDRYLSREEADRIAGRADVDELERIARRVNDLITRRAETVGMTHQDGKIECLYHHGDVLVADVVGTFDENRFAFDGQGISKEFLRQYYKETQPIWVDEVTAAKAEARDRGLPDWRSFCAIDPESLPAEVVEAAGDLYRAGANRYVDRPLFDAPSLEAAVDRVRSL